MVYFSKKVIISKNILFNYNVLKTACKKDICAVIKADAYGHGIKNIAEILKNSANFFATENLNEALEFRKFNKLARVLILSHCSNYKIAIKNNISITVDSIVQLSELARFNMPVNVHIKINTGMNRLGVDKKQEFVEMIKFISNNCNIILEGVFTHFLDSFDKKVVNKQFRQFKTFVNLLPNTKNIILHVGGGNLCFTKLPDYVNYVRVGLSLYGYGASCVKPALYIKSKIIKIHDIKKNQYVGYDQYFKALNKMRVAVVPLGYADGLSRTLQDNLYVSCGEASCKVIGKICMDMFMIDITKTKINVGDDVLIMSNASVFATMLNCTEYEVLTNFCKMRCEFDIK